MSFKKNKKVKSKISQYNFFSKNRSQEQFFVSKNRRAISTVMASVLMVLLVVVMIGVVWGVVKGIVEKQTDDSCFGNYGEVTLNNQYTCYDSENGDVQFSISVGDIDIDEVVVTLIRISDSESFTLKKSEKNVDGLKPYGYEISGEEKVKAPDKNSGLTYVAVDFGEVETIRISPVIKGKQCDVSDSITEIDACSVLAS